MDYMDRRMRTLTSGGQAMYQSNLDYYLRNLKKDWREFETILTDFDDSCTDIKYLRNVESRVEMAKYGYMDSYQSLISFLNRTRTDESELELDNQMIRHQKCLGIINNFERQLVDLLLDAAEILTESFEHRTRSEASISTTRSMEFRNKHISPTRKPEKTKYSFKEKENLKKQR